MHKPSRESMEEPFNWIWPLARAESKYSIHRSILIRKLRIPACDPLRSSFLLRSVLPIIRIVPSKSAAAKAALASLSFVAILFGLHIELTKQVHNLFLSCD